MKRLKIIIRKIYLQIFILSLFVFLFFLEKVGLIPPIETLMAFISEQFKEHGYVVIIPCSFVENLAGVNTYFPGALVILTSMSMYAGYPFKALLMFVCVYIPACLAQFVNFYVGKRMPQTENISIQRVFTLLFFTSWHPTLAAITCTRLGNARLGFFSFLKRFILATLIWGAFWGILMYNVGNVKNLGKTFSYIFFVYIFFWLLVDVLKVIKNTKSGTKS